MISFTSLLLVALFAINGAISGDPEEHFNAVSIIIEL